MNMSDYDWLTSKVSIKQVELRHGLDCAVLAQALGWGQDRTGPWLHNWEPSMMAKLV